MSTKTTNDKTPDFFKKLDQIKKGYVTIGIHEDAGSYPDGVSVVKVALWNEFGTETSPERSFFRTAIDDNLEKMNKWREEFIENIFYNGWSVEKALKAMGLRIQLLIQNKIKSNVGPDLSPYTLEKRKEHGRGTRTLVDTGLMLRSVTFKVVL
jgi:hypothetical protein